MISGEGLAGPPRAVAQLRAELEESLSKSGRIANLAVPDRYHEVEGDAREAQGQFALCLTEPRDDRVRRYAEIVAVRVYAAHNAIGIVVWRDRDGVLAYAILVAMVHGVEHQESLRGEGNLRLLDQELRVRRRHWNREDVHSCRVHIGVREQRAGAFSRQALEQTHSSCE